MVSVSQIREHLSKLLASADLEALDTFDDWFAGATWNMHQDSGQQPQKFAAAIERRLAEYDSGNVSVAQLRQQLSDLLLDYPEDTEPGLTTISRDSLLRQK